MADSRPLHRNPIAWLAGLVAVLILVVAVGAWYATRVLRALPGAAVVQALVAELAPRRTGPREVEL